MKVFIAVVVVTMVAAVSGATIDTSKLEKDIQCVIDEALKIIKDPATREKIMKIQIAAENDDGDSEDSEVDVSDIENEIKSILRGASQNFIDTWQDIVKVCKLGTPAPTAPADDATSSPPADDTGSADDAASSPPADDTKSADSS